MKCKCGNNLFYVDEVECCEDCSENGAYFEEEYIYDEKIIMENELERDEVETNGECRMGSGYGAGCYLFICSECKNKSHLPTVEGC